MGHSDETRLYGAAKREVRRARVWAMVGGVSALALATAAAGQEATRPAQLDEIIVTATKRAERLRDVPFAISAVNAETLAARGEVKLIDFSARVPGLQINDQSARGDQTAIVIRGLSGAGTGNPTTALYIDDIPLNTSTVLGGGATLPDLDPGDLARIEVLKGPQGTLYGATSLGGLVKFVTRQPEFGEFSARLEATALNVKSGDVGYGLRGRVNAPLGSDVALSLSAFKRKDPGFIDNPSRRLNNLNSANHWGARAALALRPADGLTVNLSVLSQRQDIDGGPLVFLDGASGALVAPPLEVNAIPRNGDQTTRATIVNSAVEADLGAVKLTSITSYAWRRFGGLADLNDVFGPLVAAPPPAGLGLANASAFFFSATRSEKFTQEVRLRSNATSDLLGWQLGVYYTEEESRLLKETQVADLTTGEIIANAPVLSRIASPSTYDELAGFGTLTWRISPVFDVEGGLRYSHNKQTSSQIVTRFASVTSARAESSEETTTFSINGRYRPSQNLMAYVRVASGFRPGGPNIGQTDDRATYAADSVTSYETGLKGEFLDRRLTVDFGAFHVDWKDIQLQGNDPTTSLAFFFNGGKARSKGAELAVVLTPIPGLTLDGNVAYTDAYLITAPKFPGTNAPPGSQLPYSPKWAAHLGAEYGFDVTSAWKGRAGVAYRYVGDRASFFESAATRPRFELPSYNSVDFTLGAESDRLAVLLFLRNAFDERALVSASAIQRTLRVGVVNQPRTIGVTATAKF